MVEPTTTETTTTDPRVDELIREVERFRLERGPKFATREEVDAAKWGPAFNAAVGEKQNAALLARRAEAADSERERLAEQRRLAPLVAKREKELANLHGRHSAALRGLERAHEQAAEAHAAWVAKSNEPLS